jgi:type II secretory pathway predicted ATPase ExeA
VVGVVGKSGSGKTTLLRCFSEQLPAGLYKTLALQYASGTCLDLLLHVGRQLGVEPSNVRGRMVQKIQAECAQLASRRIHPLLVVDEAHFLSNQTLQELRLLMTSELDAVRHFTLVLSGHEDLEGRLRTPWLLSLKQRVTTWVRLGALALEETEQYLAHRLKIAGVPVNLFSPEAVFALQQLSSGLLRPLDRLAHHALIACALEGSKQVSHEQVRLAAEEVGV